MKRVWTAVALSLLLALPCFAIKAMMFNSVDQYVERARGIWIVEIVKGLGNDPEVCPIYQAKVLNSLKGSAGGEIIQVGSIFNELSPGSRYLFFGFSRSSDGKVWFNNGNVSPVPIPRSFSLKELTGKTPAEQVSRIMSERIRAIDTEIKRLSEEREALRRAGLSGTLPAGASGRAKTWEGLLPQAHPVIPGPIPTKSDYPETTGRTLYLLAGESLAFYLDTPASERRTSFSGRVAYAPLLPRGGFSLTDSDGAPRWEDEWLVSDFITHEVRADSAVE